MKCLTPLIMIALLAVLGLEGFNFIQMNKMKLELAHVKSKMETVRVQPVGTANVTSQIESAHEHAKLARQMLAKGKVTQAKRELDRSIALMEKASSASQGGVVISGDGVSQAWKTMQGELDRALKEISRQIQEGRPGANGKRISE